MSTQGLKPKVRDLVVTELLKISYNEPSWLAKRHELAGVDRTADMMELALAAITEKATRDTKG